MNIYLVVCKIKYNTSNAYNNVTKYSRVCYGPCWMFSYFHICRSQKCAYTCLHKNVYELILFIPYCLSIWWKWEATKVPSFYTITDKDMFVHQLRHQKSSYCTHDLHSDPNKKGAFVFFKNLTQVLWIINDQI